MISDDEILSCLKKAGLDKHNGKLTHDVGPYDITEPIYSLRLLVKLISEKLINNMEKTNTEKKDD